MKARLLRLLYFAIPAVIFLVSVLALNAGPLLKRPTGVADDVPGAMAEVSELALSGRWQEAGAAAGRLAKAWGQVRGRVQLVAGAGEIRMFDLGLAELQGAVEGREAAAVRIAQRKLLVLWDHLAP